MFKIESYITSIILANADRYIKNFRKQDAQVSLWEGDATFHNIDLNVDALNEELQSSFLITSGYIHDLTIHVPWTKLMSEPVTISVNTIECVMRLKSQDEKLTSTTEKHDDVTNVKLNVSAEKRVQEEITSPSSYTSTLTNKIMNNLSIRCKNVILKLVEEDIVFSMNIEKLNFDNVNDSWVPTMTDVNMEKLLTRKLITLSGVTICLDKQNSSGRIDTYLEPLLYRCLIHVRLLRGYNRAVSMKPVYTHFDLSSDGMSFTISEPQIPMLLKLGAMIFSPADDRGVCAAEKTLPKHEGMAIVSGLDTDSEDNGEEHEDESTWSNWLWSMIPSILPQEENGSSLSKRKINAIFHVGFCVKHLDINIKLWNNRSQKKSKQEFRDLLQCKFYGCMYRMTMRNSEWFNVQFGVNHVSVEIPANESDCKSRIKQILFSGTNDTDDFTKETLFDENFAFSSLKIHEKARDDPVEDLPEPSESSSQSLYFNCIYATEFSVDRHLNFYTENTLLARTSAFAIDYVKSHKFKSQIVTSSDSDGSYDNDNSDDSLMDVSRSDSEPIPKNARDVLLRFIFGATVVKITSDVVNRIMHLRKIISFDGSSYCQSVSGVGIKQNVSKNQAVNYTAQFTLFDLSMELHVSSSSNTYVASRHDSKFMDIPETYSLCQSTPIIILFCKCIDGMTRSEVKKDLGIHKTTKIKTADIVCSLLQSNQKNDLLKCEMFDWECSRNVNNTSVELRFETKNVVFKSSKPNMLLACYVTNYLLCTVWQSEEKQNYYAKIFFSSLIDDTFALDNTVLEVLVENLIVSYKSEEEAYGFSVAVNSSRAYASKLLDDVPKRIMIFTALDTETESECIKLMFQTSRNGSEKCNYPSCIWFSVQNLSINLDLIFYSWITYEPVPNSLQKGRPKMNRSVKENSISKNVPSRKISDASSGSHGRKYGTAYPKPKESVHSSSEPELQSPPEVTDTEPSDVFQMADTVVTPKEKEPFIHYLSNKIHVLCNYIVHGELSQITVYFPTSHTDVLYDCDANHVAPKSFRCVFNHDGAGIVKFFLKSFKIKCDTPASVFEELDRNTLISVSKDVWSYGRLTSPWAISVTDINVNTLFEDRVCESLLEPLSVNCTVGMSFRDGTADESAIALCVHFDFQPIFVDLTKKQVLLISAVVEILNRLSYTSRETIVVSNDLSTKSPATVITEMSETIQNKLTGWIQWTFTKFCLSVYTADGAEEMKLCVESEDSIVSLEFDEVFHKLKVKTASFGVYHRERCSESEPWRPGPFYGSVIQKCYSKSQNSSKSNEDDTDDRFLLATITRARSSNLKTRLLSSGNSEIPASASIDRYVTEIILNMCATDIILPLVVIEKFLSVLKPLMSVCQKSSDDSTQSVQKDVDVAFSSLPIVYFDIPTLRVFVPISTCQTADTASLCDTLVLEINNVCADCHPKYPIIRKPLHSKVFYSLSGKRYTTVEQKLQNQQYQIFAMWISINTSTWSKIERMILQEQLSVEEPPSAFEQNPAVMWNQGCHPGTKDRINLRHLTPIISKFSCLVQIAPSVECFSLKTTIQGPYFEIGILTALRITIALHQISLLVALGKEYATCILPCFEYVERESSQMFSYSPNNVIGNSRMVDSGIESLEQNSVASSSVSKNKSEIPVQNVHHAKATNTSVSRISQICQPGTYSKKILLKEVYVAAPSVQLTLYKITRRVENDEQPTSFEGLVFCELLQPFVCFSNESNYPAVQVDIFNASAYIPDLPAQNTYLPDFPNRLDFGLKIVDVRKSNCDPYSRIMNSCFSLKMVQNLNQKWRMECNIGQPVFIDCDTAVIQYVLSSINVCVEEYRKYTALFSNCDDWNSAPKSDETELDFVDKFNSQFNRISNFSLSTSRVVTIYKPANKGYCLLLTLDAVTIAARSPRGLKNPNESVSIQCGLKSVTVSLPKCHSNLLSEVLSNNDSAVSGKTTQHDVLSNLVLKPWNMNVELLLVWQRWNLFRKNPWKCLKIDSENIVVNLSPCYAEKLSDIVGRYSKLYEECFPSKYGSMPAAENAEDTSSEFYKDDLRAGAFQYIKNDDNKSDLPSPYEVVFCNRRVQSYMSWKYPQPRSLTKLQIYPVPIEEVNENYPDDDIHCQLQYYNEVTNVFYTYVTFDLCENAIQNVTLPKQKPQVAAAECWRIVLLENANSKQDCDFKIDIKSLVGCVRVDSVFQPSLVPTIQFLMNITEVQLNFSTLCQNKNIMIDEYSVDYCPSEQHFLCLACSDVKILLSDFKTEKILNVSGIGRASILNYEYLMLQSFIDPFVAETILYVTEDETVTRYSQHFQPSAESSCKLACKMKTVHLRISPNFVHTLSVAHNLWCESRKDAVAPWRMTAPYVICNNTNHLIMFHQENTSEEIYLSPFWCNLFAWYNPAFPKLIKVSVFSGKRKYTSEPFSIKHEGSHAIKCKSTDDESCVISVSVVKHSSVVHQVALLAHQISVRILSSGIPPFLAKKNYICDSLVRQNVGFRLPKVSFLQSPDFCNVVIVRGSLLLYNVTQSEMDMCVVSYGKECSKTKLSSAQLVTGTSLLKHQLLSVVLPLEHRLSFKIRFSSSPGDGEHSQWSGLISLAIPQRSSNQTSWMVKIPLKGLKEHFQSLWCQVTWEIVEGLPRYLVVFRPLCTIVSYLPWKSYVRIANDLGAIVSASVIADKGASTDLFIPDTVSLDKYTIECRLTEDNAHVMSKVKLETVPRQKLSDAGETETRIYSLIEDISSGIRGNSWPFLNAETMQFRWKTDQVHDIKPTVKVFREEDRGCGSRVELYPWAIIVNMLNYQIVLDISDSIYNIESYEIIAPPSIESTFKLGLVEDGRNHPSGVLQLSDDQSFPIPKVTGRIPMNGFITTMIDCDAYVTFVNIASKNHKEMRIISVCSSYVINNSSSFQINCSAWVVCRSGNKTSTSFDVPSSFVDKSISLAAKGNASVGQSIVKWYKIGNGDVQVLPYLILSVNGNLACPVRVCDLSETQRYPVVFSSGKLYSEADRLPCIFMTAQQSEGQVFLTIWDETTPHITIHNMSQLPLNVISSKSEDGVEGISYCLDWNWKFSIAAQSSAHYCVQKQVSEKHKKQITEYLMFSVESSKPIKQTKWSSGVPLTPCVNQLITLPLSQHHIKMAIFRNGFTYVVWIESATADELSAKMIRARLSESFLPIKEGAVIPLTQENSTRNDEFEIPVQLVQLYNNGIFKPIRTNIVIEEILFTLAYEDEVTSEENDIATFCAKNVLLNFSSTRSPNEVSEQILCRIDIGEYQLDNDEYHLRAFDFPVIMLNQPIAADVRAQLGYQLEDLLTHLDDRECSAVKINVCLKAEKHFSYDVRDVYFVVSPMNVYLEDKYLLKLRTALENIFSATVESSTLEENVSKLDAHGANSMKLDLLMNSGASTPAFEAVDKEKACETPKVKSSSSKSVNVSECDFEDKISVTPTVPESCAQYEDVGPKAAPVDGGADETDGRSSVLSQHKETANCILVPKEVMKRSRSVARPLRLRGVYVSSFSLAVSVHTSTTFYIALDRSPLCFSEFKKDYLVTTPFELGNLLVVHYFFGAVYGTGWAISSLEFVGSPGVLARNLGTGIRDFVSMPIYGIASGPRGFVLGVAHGSASLMKHVMAGTLSSVTNFAGSWARTLNRFTLDTDDLLQSEQFRRFPPSNIAEGVLQGLSEFGISLLGGISGIAHHPLQYAVSNTGNRSLLNSISLGIVGVLTRPLSGAAELVARTGQGIMSHVGWNAVPAVRNASSSCANYSSLQMSNVKCQWKREFEDVIVTVEGVDAQNLVSSLWIILTCGSLHVVEMTNAGRKFVFELQTHQFRGSENDPTLIVVQKQTLNYKNAEDFSRARIYRFINDTNHSFNIKSPYAAENALHLSKTEVLFSFYVNPQIKNFLLNTIGFVKNVFD